jgi:hypothetical protein
MVHYVQRPQSRFLYWACLTPSLSTFLNRGGIASFWNLKLRMFGGQVSMISKNRLTENSVSIGSYISPCAFCIICSMRTLSPTLKVTSQVSLPWKRSWLSLAGSSVSIISARAGGGASGNWMSRPSFKSFRSGILYPAFYLLYLLWAPVNSSINSIV